MTARRKAQNFGRLAEAACRLLLRLKGYRILARNVRTPAGEIDIVARRGCVLAFIEVKARVGEARADALTPRQQRRLNRAAEAFLMRHPRLARLQPRFDLVLASPWRMPQHMADAWRPDDR